jgi:probable F420-dependent oxidoreductase
LATGAALRFPINRPRPVAQPPHCILNQKEGHIVSAVQIGLALPIEGDVVRFATEAERLGFDYVTAPEHVAFHVPVPNSFTWLAAAAAATRSIRLVSTVALPALYPSVLFAKMVASVDYLSGGRLSVGVGVGGEYPAEFEASGVKLSERGARTDEALEVLSLLLNASEPIDFNGRFARFEQILLAPRASDRCPPIWVGGRQEAAMRRAARFADVWMPYMFTPEQTARGRAVVAGCAAEFGRSPEEIGTAIYSFAVVSDDLDRGRQHALEFAARRYRQDFGPLAHKFLVGSPAHIVERMGQYVDVGASSFVLELACDAAMYDEQLERIANEVVPQLSGVVPV